MSIIGHRNELQHYNKRQRTARMTEIAGRVLFFSIFGYLLIALLEKFA